MDAWELSLADAELYGERIVWGWALRRPPGAGLLDPPLGFWYGTTPANDDRFGR